MQPSKRAGPRGVAVQVEDVVGLFLRQAAYYFSGLFGGFSRVGRAMRVGIFRFEGKLGGHEGGEKWGFGFFFFVSVVLPCSGRVYWD